MFERFFREAAALERFESRIKAEAKQWIDEKDESAKGAARALARKQKAARRDTAKCIRRLRIKEYHLENHDLDLKDESFDGVEEDRAQDEIAWCECWSHLDDCTESPEEKLIARSRADSKDFLRMMDQVRDRRPTEANAEASEERIACIALDLLAYPRPEPDYDDTYDGLEDEEAAELYQRLNNPSPPPDESEEEEEEEEDEWAHGPFEKNQVSGRVQSRGESDEWGALSDWAEEEQTW
jgi:hypothetical protein